MNNEKYLNYYIETLTGTMTDAIIRNISLQANARVTEELIGEQVKRIEELSAMEANRNSENETEITNLNSKLENLNKELNELKNQKVEFENVKHQVQHIDTFRSELVKERDLHQKTRLTYDKMIKELKQQIDYLQLTPAKRKKIDEAKTTKTVDVFSNEITDTIKDGGSF